MKKLTLYLPDELFDHLSILPTFLNYDKKKFPIMLLSEELMAEREVLGKLSELYDGYEDDNAEVMVDACSKRIDEIKEMALNHCRENGIELIAVGNETVKDRLKDPIKELDDD